MAEIIATMVIEILGRPAEHIKSALTSLVDKLSAEKGIKITDRTIHEPVPVKESTDLFTSFAEVNIEFESLENYFGVIFSYMPAHVEIISPTKFDISNSQLNELGNKILARLHDYDAITKKILYERDFLVKKLHEVAPHLFKQPAAPAETPATPKPEEAKKEEKKTKKKSKK